MSFGETQDMHALLMEIGKITAERDRATQERDAWEATARVMGSERDEAIRVRDEYGADIRRMCGTMTPADINSERQTIERLDKMAAERDQARAEAKDALGRAEGYREAAACEAIGSVSEIGATPVIECCAIPCDQAIEPGALIKSGWDVNRNGLWYCPQHADHAPSHRTSELEAEIYRLRDELASYGRADAEAQDLAKDNEALRVEVARLTAEPVRLFDHLSAERLADEVEVLIERKVIDARSPAADALLDYRNPPRTPRSDRLMDLEKAQADASLWCDTAIRRRRETAEAIAVWILGYGAEPIDSALAAQGIRDGKWRK